MTQTLIITQQGVADAVEDAARKVTDAYSHYTGSNMTYESLMQDFLLKPKPEYAAYPHKRAYSYDNHLIRLQTALSVLMDAADSVAEQELGLTDRTGLVLRYLIDRKVREARRLVDSLAQAAERFGVNTTAPIFGEWPNAGRELVRNHLLFDPDSTELL